MNLPDYRVGGVLDQNVLVSAPALGVGILEVADHASASVNAYSLGIYVLSFTGYAVNRYKVSVVKIL